MKNKRMFMILIVMIVGILIIPSFSFASTPKPTTVPDVSLIQESTQSVEDAYVDMFNSSLSHIEFYDTYNNYWCYCVYHGGSGWGLFDIFKNNNLYTTNLNTGFIWFSYDGSQWVYHSWSAAGSLNSPIVNSMDVESIDANYTIYNEDGTVYRLYSIISITSPVANSIYDAKPDINIDVSNVVGSTVTVTLNGDSWSQVVPITVNSDSVLSFLGSTVPYKAGNNLIDVYVDGNLKNSVSFTISSFVVPAYYWIEGVSDGQQYMSPQSFYVGKNCDYNIEFWFNGTLMTTIRNNNSNVYYTSGNLNWTNGYNTLTLKKASDGTILLSKKVTIINLDGQYSTNVDSNGKLIQDNTSLLQDMINQVPQAPTDDNIISWMSYIFKYILYFLSYLLIGIGTIIKTLFDVLGALINGIGNLGFFMKDLFAFMPAQLSNVLILGVVCVVIISILKTWRGGKA